MDVSVVIPNYNGMAYIGDCLDSLAAQCRGRVEVIVVDNGSTDGSLLRVQTDYPWVRVRALAQNAGFSRAVNEGIRISRGEFVILLNNDTRVAPDFVEQLRAAICAHADAFSCQAQMRQMDSPDRIDSAGDLYCALGWAISRGKDKPHGAYETETQIFSACAGAAIYRKCVFSQIGLFDEAHFAYLEDVDIGYRARRHGYQNWYAPKAVVWHKGSAVSGKRHNPLKVRLAARNNLYLIYKNMPFWQIALNLPFFLFGVLVKWLFFLRKGMGGAYAKGLAQGMALTKKSEKPRDLKGQSQTCRAIQAELWKNMAGLWH